MAIPEPVERYLAHAMPADPPPGTPEHAPFFCARVEELTAAQRSQIRA